MKRLKKFLPHLSFSLLLALLVILYLDIRNPNMAFLASDVTRIYITITCITGIVSALISMKGKKRKR